MVAKALKDSLSDSERLILWFANCRNLSSLFDVVGGIQRKYGVAIPKTDEEWAICPRLTIDVRRDKVLEDAIREARKDRFRSSTLLKVYSPAQYRCMYRYAKM